MGDGGVSIPPGSVIIGPPWSVIIGGNRVDKRADCAYVRPRTACSFGGMLCPKGTRRF